MRLIRTAVSVAVLAGATAVAFQLSTGSAAADTATLLPIKSAADLVVDGAHRRIFISDPLSGQIITTDYAGRLLATASGLPGVRDLLLTDRLYAAVPDAGAIVAFDPATTTLRDTYDTGGEPRTLASAAGKIWFGEDRRGLGSLDLSGPVPVVARGSANGLTQVAGWSNAPKLATTPSRPNLVAAADTAVSPDTFSILDVSTDPPTPVTSRSGNGRALSLAFSPDGNRLIVAGSRGLEALSTTDLSTVEGYRTVGSSPHAVAVREDGMIAAAADGETKAVALYAPGAVEAAKTLNLRAVPDLSLNLTSLSSALAWEPGGVRLFGVAVKISTASSKPDSILSLQILNDPTPTPVTIRLTVPATAQPGKAYQVTGRFSTPAPVGLPLVITRADPSTPGGRRVGPETVPDYGSFVFDDVQTVAGTVTYTVSVPGDEEFAAGTATGSVAVAPLKPTSLTLDRNSTTWAYGSTVTFTAKLGATGPNRVVEIWADPYGNDQPNRLLKKATVDGKGNLAASFKLTRNTIISAVYRGDARTTAKTVKSSVGAKASVATTVSRHYKTAKIGSVSYHHFRKTKHPLFTTTMTPYPRRSQHFQIDVYTRGKWMLWGPGYYPVTAAGKSVKELKGAHSTGVRYRMRSAYLYAKSGDSANATSYGPYRYFTFTK